MKSALGINKRGRTGRPDNRFSIALAGQPNTGKTTLFNTLTGARQHTGNWPGVTVEKKQGIFTYGENIYDVVDLPGTYSLTAYSLEEIVARDFVTRDAPDVVVDVVDAASLERNLYLTIQLIELGANVVVALNMSDVARARGIVINDEELAVRLGVPVVPMVATRKQSRAVLADVIKKIPAKEPSPDSFKFRYSDVIEKQISVLSAAIEKHGGLDAYPIRWLALKLIEDDRSVVEMAKASTGVSLIKTAEACRKEINDLCGESADTLIATQRYDFINSVVSKAVSYTAVYEKRTISDRIDSVVTSRLIGLPLFFVLMWLTFEATFTLGAYPMGWIDTGFVWLGDTVSGLLPDGMLKSLIVDGIIGGVGGIVVFLPNILILFFALALLEDTGYMSRAAFIMDRVMHRVGLHGKSFIPMLVGFGCNVPAVMAARTLENRRDRLVTILTVPFMSCGARLPVYLLLAGAFFSEKVAGKVIFSMYMIGIAAAVITAMLLRGFVLKGASTPFVMELPDYKLPTARSVAMQLWDRAWQYLKKAGTVILFISVLMWFLTAVPQNFRGRAQLEKQLATATEEKAAEIEARISSLQLENSFAGRIGHAMEPFMSPLGLNWKSNIAILSGFVAKEAVVSTMGTIYSVSDADEKSRDLRDRLLNDPSFNPLVAFVVMLFTLLTIPCMVTLIVIYRETRSWKWTVFSIVYYTGFAWVTCLLVYQIGSAAGIGMG